MVEATGSYLVGFYLMLPLGHDSWRWMLASSAVPAIFILLARLNMPESTLWLASKGKGKEANKIIQRIFGENVILSENLESKEKTSFSDICGGSRDQEYDSGRDKCFKQT